MQPYERTHTLTNTYTTHTHIFEETLKITLAWLKKYSATQLKK